MTETLAYGTHLRVLSECYLMNTNIRMKVALALEGLMG